MKSSKKLPRDLLLLKVSGWFSRSSNIAEVSCSWYSWFVRWLVVAIKIIWFWGLSGPRISIVSGWVSRPLPLFSFKWVSQWSPILIYVYSVQCLVMYPVIVLISLLLYGNSSFEIERILYRSLKKLLRFA